MARDYFSHDYNARNDKKLTNLFMKHGLIGIGAYWCIIEMLYEEGGYLLLDEYERITFELRSDYELIKSVIENFYLFQFDNEKFWSDTALNRLNQRAEKSQKARESIEKRWLKYERNTNVLQTNDNRNTIKESKVKEIKVKESKILIPEFEEFKNYALLNEPLIDVSALKLKYEAWKVAGWKNGNGKKIINWKSSLLNTIPHMNKTEIKKELINDKWKLLQQQEAEAKQIANKNKY